MVLFATVGEVGGQVRRSEKMKRIISTLLAVVFCAIATSCGTCGKALHTKTDTTIERIKVKEVTKYIRDTVEIRVPEIRERVVIKDTTSHLENAFAQSDASIDTAGFLHHSLQTKPTPVKVEIKTKEVRKDSIIYRDRVRVEKVPVIVKKPLSWWGKTQQVGFWVLLLVVAVIAAAKNYTKIIAVVLKLLTKF